LPEHQNIAIFYLCLGPLMLKLYFSKLTNFLEKNLFWYASIFWGLLFIYWPLIATDPFIFRDDHLLVDPLFQLSSFTEFWRHIFSLKGIDFQPVRDLSFMIDVFCKKIFNFSTFHLSNVIIWFGCVVLIFKTFRTSKTVLGSLLIALFCFHPSFAMVVSWIAARKHLLAFFFILLAFYFVLHRPHNWRNTLVVFLFYLLSVFSQPITLPWPLWYLFYLLYKRTPKKTAWLSAAPFVSLMILVTWLNHALYTYHYQALNKLTQVSNVASLEFFPSFKPALLLYGRAVYQFFIPLNFSLNYNIEYADNFWGLVLLALFLFFSFHFLGAKKTFLWILSFFLSLVIVALKIRNLFMSDTYLLWAFLSLFILLVETVAQSKRKFVLPLAAVLLLGCFIKSHSVARYWTSDLMLLEKSFANEPDCSFAPVYAKLLYENDLPDKANEVVNFVVNNHCFIAHSQFNLSVVYLSVFHRENIDLNDKIKYFQEHTKDLEATLLLGLIYLSQSNSKKAWELIGPLLQKDYSFLYFGGYKKLLLGLFQTCQQDSCRDYTLFKHYQWTQ
jgi:hypothetical protein